MCPPCRRYLYGGRRFWVFATAGPARQAFLVVSCWLKVRLHECGCLDESARVSQSVVSSVALYVALSQDLGRIGRGNRLFVNRPPSQTPQTVWQPHPALAGSRWTSLGTPERRQPVSCQGLWSGECLKGHVPRKSQLALLLQSRKRLIGDPDSV